MIAKRLDEALAARNKLYEASQQHHLEVCDMKRQIKNLEEERSKLQEENSRLQKQLQTAQACKFYRTTIHPAMLYGVEYWPTKRRHVQQLSIAEMRMLQWFCGHTRRDRVRNEVIWERAGVALAPIEEKLTQHRLRLFRHIQRRPPEAPVRSGVLKRVDKVKRGTGRPKLTWDESVKRDLNDCNISEEVALDRNAWRLAISVPEP